MVDPGGTSNKPPKVFITGLKKWIEGPLSDFLRVDLRDLTQATEGNDLKISLLMGEFDLLPEDQEAFRKKIAAARGQQEIPPLENTIRMAGIQNTQAHLIVVKVARGFASRLLPIDAGTGIVTIAPKTALAYAHRARAFVGDDSRYADGAFAGGLVFDLLALYANTDAIQPPLRPAVLEILSVGFERALVCTRLGQGLARRMKHLTLEAHIAPTLLLHEAAEAAAALLFPEHAERLKIWAKSNFPYALRVREEERQLGAPASVLGETLALISPTLEAAGKAVAEINTPYTLLASKERDPHDLAALARLSIELFERPELLKSTELKPAKKFRPELKDLELSVRCSELAAEGKKK